MKKGIFAVLTAVLLAFALSGCVEEAPQSSCGPVPPRRSTSLNSLIDSSKVELLEPKKTIMAEIQIEEDVPIYQQEKDFVKLLLNKTE